MPQIPITEIHDDPATNVRRIAASRMADDALTASIRSQGVLQPIVVRPNGNGYKVVFGRRRLRCAAAAGLTEIPAIIMQMTDAWAIAADAAENMTRASLHPLDQWRAVSALVDAGMKAAEAAAAIGLDERQTRRVERLGRLHPDVVALMAFSMPGDRYLAAIAMAPPTDQARAAKAKGAVERAKGEISYVAWHVICDALRITRLSRSLALFDTDASGLAWEEDFFAEPGIPDQFTTTDVTGFLKHQHAAVEALAAARRAKKQTVEILDPHTDTLPKGYTEVWDGDRDKPKRHHTVFLSIDGGGVLRTRLATHDATERAAAKKRAEREIDTRGNDGYGDEAPDAAAPKLPFTKAGLKAIAEIKTAALRERLQELHASGFGLAPEALRLMLLALCATNVEIRGAGFGGTPRDALAAKLLLPGGTPAPLEQSDLVRIAGETLAGILRIPGPDEPRYGAASGAAAEWIGAAIGADHALPRFDTPAFLATVKGAELKRLAADIGMKATGDGDALRAMLAGKLPDWRPCAFGAPAPVLTLAQQAAAAMEDAA